MAEPFEIVPLSAAEREQIRRDGPGKIVAAPARSGMTLAEFHNGLRILLNLDRHVLVQAGVLPHGDHNAWGTFTRDPYRFFIRADDATAEKLWTLMQTRMKP